MHRHASPNLPYLHSNHRNSGVSWRLLKKPENGANAINRARADSGTGIKSIASG